MPDHAASPPRLQELAEVLIESYRTDERTQHIDASFLPSRDRTIQILELLRRLVFPGFFDQQRLTSDNLEVHVEAMLGQVRRELYEQMRQALRYELNRAGDRQGETCDQCDTLAAERVATFLQRLPEVRRMLALDVQAAFDGDPAAVDTDETIFCYPGVRAIFVHRIAHELYKLDVPLLPRIMSEYAHSKTGIDIHPGATIGDSFFIDHGTGVVIGETSVIGDRVQIYQGVTLGALAPKDGERWRGRKRHPTIENDVTIYGGAIILGGDTVIGEGATIGGSVFITASVPAHHTVKMKSPELTMRPRRGGRKREQASESGEQFAS